VSNSLNIVKLSDGNHIFCVFKVHMWCVSHARDAENVEMVVF
jgi:hypothetical protein